MPRTTGGSGVVTVHATIDGLLRDSYTLYLHPTPVSQTASIPPYSTTSGLRQPPLLSSPVELPCHLHSV